MSMEPTGPGPDEAGAAAPDVQVTPPFTGQPTDHLPAGTGYPYQPQPPSARPRTVAAAWHLARRSLHETWCGNPIEALRLGITSESVTGRRSGYWLCVLGLQAILVGLVTATFTVKMVNAAVDAASSLVDGLTFGLGGSSVRDSAHLSFGAWLGVAVVGVVIAFACLVLRAVTVRWVFALRSAPVPFVTTADIVATAYLPQTLPLALAFVVTAVLPAGVGATLLLVLVGIVALVPTILAEGIVYIGLNRTVRFAKSPLLPNAVMTLVWLALCGLVVLVVNSLVVSSLLR